MTVFISITRYCLQFSLILRYIKQDKNNALIYISEKYLPVDKSDTKLWLECNTKLFSFPVNVHHANKLFVC